MLDTKINSMNGELAFLSYRLDNLDIHDSNFLNKLQQIKNKMDNIKIQIEATKYMIKLGLC